MTRYIDLCVELKKGREAKDGLIHYRNVCQHVNVSSLEEVIKYFLKTATDKAEEAQSKADLVPPHPPYPYWLMILFGMLLTRPLWLLMGSICVLMKGCH